jgi:hypothetical protein
MAGFFLLTDMEPAKVRKAVARLGRRLGFAVHQPEDWEFELTQGNLLLSIFLGAFIAYCDFRVTINEGRREGTVEIEIERNRPWWTGWLGVSRVKKRAKQLADELGDEIEDLGCRVLKEKEF